MARVSKFTDEQRLQIALDLLAGKLARAEVCRKFRPGGRRPRFRLDFRHIQTTIG